jgi:hypothetical protein
VPLPANAACEIGTRAAYLSMIARGGMDERDWVASLLPAVEEAAQDLPRLRRGTAAQRDKDPRQTREDSFMYGLDRVLDGLEARITGEHGHGRRRT